MVKDIYEYGKRAISLAIQIHILKRISNLQPRGTAYARSGGNLDMLIKTIKYNVIHKTFKSKVETDLISCIIALKGIQKLSGFEIKPSQIKRDLPDELTKEFKIDLEDWGYKHLIDPSKKAIDAIQLILVLDPDSFGPAGGFEYTFKNPRIWISPFHGKELNDYTHGKTSISLFKSTLLDLSDTIGHELQHMSQQILSETPDNASVFTNSGQHNKGLPKKEDLNLEHSQNYKKKNQTEYEAYYLDDSEFFPFLRSQILILMQNLNKLPENKHKEFIKDAISGAKYNKKLVVTYDLIVFPSDDDRLAPLFYYLKKHNPGKYRKAVKETISALGKEGYL